MSENSGIGGGYRPGPAGKSPMPTPAPVDAYGGQYKDVAEQMSVDEKFGTAENPVREIAPPFRITGGNAA